MNMELPVGSWFTVRTTGTAAALIRWGTNSPVNHAGIYIGDGRTVEAEPNGATHGNIANYLDAYWCTQFATPTVAAAAETLIGIPYGWTDIAAISLAQSRLGKRINPDIPIDRQPYWVRRLIDPATAICSQLVDMAYLIAGIHLFTDGRLPGLVSPGDLLKRGSIP